MSTIHIRIEIVSNRVAYQQYGGTNVGPVTEESRHILLTLRLSRHSTHM